MLDQILTGLIEEVALEGESGCTLSQFFELVENFAKKKYSQINLRKPLLFDEKYISFLWKFIRCNEQLVFTKNNVVLDVLSLSYQQIVSDTEPIFVQAVEQVQDQILYGSLKSEKNNLTAAHRKVLSVIAKCRSQGVSQFQLRELLDMDGKTVFRYIKKLDELGFIVKEEAYANNISTRIIFHRRFAYDSSPSQEDSKQIENGVIYRIPDFKHDILEQLRKSPNQMMGMLELIKSLGFESRKQIRWARVRLTELHDQGLVERLIASDGKHKRHVVRLFEQNSTGNTEEEQQEEIPSQIQPRQTYSMYRDLPADYVFYRDLLEAGDHGLSRQEVLNKYPMLDPVLPLAFFDNGTIPSKDPSLLRFLIYRTEELEGKQRQFRYFSSETWQRICSKMGKEVPSIPQVEAPVFDDLVEPDRVDSIGFGIQQLISLDKKRATDPLEKKSKRQKRDTKTTRASSSQLHTSKSTQKKRAREESQSSEDAPEKPTDTANKQPKVSVWDVKKFKKISHDTTKARRCAILLDLVEKYRICELGRDLYQEFTDIEAGIQNTTKIARGTFEKLVIEMHRDKQLRLLVTSIQRPSGLTEIKKIILHKDLTEESESVKQYIGNFSVERSIVSNKNKVRQIQEINVDVLPPSASSSAISSPRLSKMDEAHLPRRLASNYGYIRSIWQRARSFHEALLCFCQIHHTDTVEMTEFMKTLPFERILNFAILPYDDDTLIEFLKDSSNRSVAMQDLPKPIRSIIYQNHTKIRAVLVRMLNILEALELLKPVEGDVSCQQRKYKYIQSSYVLCRVANVRIYARKEKPIKQTVQLNSLEDVEHFWSELKVFNTSGFETVDNDMNESHPLLNIWSPYTWTSGLWFTPQQKSVLDSYIDFENKQVPSEDDSTIRAYLVKKVELSNHRIKVYYESMRKAFDKSKMREEKAKKKADSMSSSSPAVNELMKASLEKRKVNAALFKMRQAEPFVEQTFVGSRKIRRLRLVSEPYRGQDKIGRSRFRVPPPAYSRVEEDALVYAYSIMKARASASTFYWGPISKVLPAHTPERSRRVLSHMMKKDPRLSGMIEELKKKWLEIYKDSIASNEIQDEKPWDTQEFDLPGYLTHFIQKLQAVENAKRVAFLSDTDPLPKTLAELRMLFDVVHSTKPSELVSEVDSTDSSRTEAFDAATTLTSSETKEKSVACVASLIKMILVTPEALYSAKDAFHMLKEFSESIIEEAVRRLKSDGLIIGEKSKYGRVPGRNINVSEKFLNIAAGLLPYEFFKTARLFYQLIEPGNSIDIESSKLNSGQMATLLDLLSQRKLTISLRNNDKLIDSKNVLHYPKASAVSMREAFVYDKLDIKIQANIDSESTKDRGNVLPNYADTPTHDQISSTLELLKSKQPAVQTVYTFISDHKERGATHNEIDSALDYTREALSEALDLLLNSKPALVAIFGFEHLRYVSTEFYSHWMLRNPQNDQYVPPLMWYDVSGGLTEPALEGCENTVMSHILCKPGVSFANLRKSLQPLFSEFELYSVLRGLMAKQKIKSRKIRKTTCKKMVFGTPSIQSVPGTSFGTSSEEATYYWPSPSYYLS